MNTFSRFSVLCPEVDLNSAHRIRTKPKQEKVKKDSQKGQNKVPPKPATGNADINKKKKNETNDLQALAFGFGRPKNSKKSSGQNSKPPLESKKPAHKNNTGSKGKSHLVNGGVKDEDQDDDWNKRDEEFVKNQNEKCLREAILQSKLEFEECKKKVEVDDQNEKEKPVLSKGNKVKRKKSKPITISLEQFNNLQPNELAKLNGLKLDKKTIEESTQNVNNPEKVKEKFFRDVDDATKRTMERERRLEQFKQLKATSNKVNHDIQVKNFIAEIEKRDFEIQALRLEVDSLNSQMQAVKCRNKKLCEVISFSEMRSKGELVVELEKATKGRDEFSEEIATLTAELEQEKTKVSNLTMELKKLQQGKKRNADSSSK